MKKIKRSIYVNLKCQNGHIPLGKHCTKKSTGKLKLVVTKNDLLHQPKCRCTFNGETNKEKKSNRF